MTTRTRTTQTGARNRKPPAERTAPMRSARFVPTTFDAETRSVEVVMSSELPVEMWDWERWDWVPEVLLSDGCECPSQAPVLDAHNRQSISQVIGSAAKARVEPKGTEDAYGRLIGRVTFSADDHGAARKISEGHLTDVSVGYERLATTYIREGETMEINGQLFVGPINVTQRWRLNELSFVPIGADSLAKVRSKRSAGMPSLSRAMRKALVQAGMPAGATEREALAFARRLGRTGRREDPAPEGENEDPEDDEDPEDPEDDEVPAPASEGENEDPEEDDEPRAKPTKRRRSVCDEIPFDYERISRAIQKNLDEREAKRKKFAAQVRKECGSRGLPPEVAARISTDAADIAEARSLMLDAMASGQRSLGPMAPQLIASGVDKHLGAVRSAMTARSIEHLKPETQEKLLPVKERADGWQTLRHMRLLDLAKESLEAVGVSTRGLSRSQIAIAALGFHRQAGIRATPAYHTTGMFADITLDAINKSVVGGWMEVNTTFDRVFRKGQSASDFKTLHRIRMSEAADLEVWPTNSTPAQMKFSDERESYAVEAYSKNVSLEWRLIVNDDMDVLSRIPSLLGAAAKRTMNRVAWALVVANSAVGPTLQDSQPLFSTATGNRLASNHIASGGAAPSVSELQRTKNLMRQTVGMNGAILNIEPRFIVVPSALETVTLQLVKSAYDPAATSSVNVGVFNPASTLEPVIEPLLDATSTTGWYLFADPNQADHIEYTYLEGQEQPVTRDWLDQENLTQNFSVLQTFGVGAIDYRGCARNKGAA